VDYRIFEDDLPGAIRAEISFELTPSEWARVFGAKEQWVISGCNYSTTDLVRLTFLWTVVSAEIPRETSSQPGGPRYRVIARIAKVTAGESLVLFERSESGAIRCLEEQTGGVFGYGTNTALMDRTRKELFGDRGAPGHLLIVDAERTVRPVDTFGNDSKMQEYQEERIPENLPEALAFIQDRVKPFKSGVLDALQQDLRTLFPAYPAIRSLLESEQGRRDIYFGAYPSTQVGAGVKQVLSCLYQLRQSPAGIVVVEEPEIHLHPEMQRVFFRYLRELAADRQLIITSHSPSIVAETTLDSIRLIRSRHGRALVEQLEPEGISALSAELGVMPRDIFEFEAVLVVEGVTDELVFAEIARRDSLKHPGGLHVAVVPAGGWGSVGAYANAALLRRLNRPYLVVFDGDTDTVPSASKAKSAFLDRSRIDIRRTVTLERPTIEHYVVSPQSIVRAFPTLERERVASALSRGELGDLKEPLRALFLQDLGRKLIPADLGRVVGLSPDDEIPEELWRLVRRLRTSH